MESMQLEVVPSSLLNLRQAIRGSLTLSFSRLDKNKHKET